MVDTPAETWFTQGMEATTVNNLRSLLAKIDAGEVHAEAGAVRSIRAIVKSQEAAGEWFVKVTNGDTGAESLAGPYTEAGAKSAATRRTKREDRPGWTHEAVKA